MDDVIITTTNVLCTINYQVKNCMICWIPTGYTTPIIDLPLPAVYQLSYFKNNLLYCYSLCLCNSVISFQIVTNLI